MSSLSIQDPKDDSLYAFQSSSQRQNALLKDLWSLAPSEVPLVLKGETGTGKTYLAKCIHHLSNRRDQPFVVIDCTALNPSLIESELFGHVKGAFTSAHSNRTGMIESANGGTIFIDEISDLPLFLQGNMLRVVEEGRIRPVGMSEEKQIDVRWICASRKDLKECVKQEKFRDDLYYRLSGATFPLMPLRERREDIPFYANHYLREVEKSYETHLTSGVKRVFQQHSWPGNLRELRKCLQTATILCGDDYIDTCHINLETDALDLIRNIGEGDSAGVVVGDSIEFATNKLIQATMNFAQGNIAVAAAKLNISRHALNKKISALGIKGH